MTCPPIPEEAERGQSRYYLGVRVEVLEDCGGGWWLCRWPDGREWKHWHEQLEPIGQKLEESLNG